MSSFHIGQTLRCVSVPDRHDGYFNVGDLYRVAHIDAGDTDLPLLMSCSVGRSSIDLWCESEAFASIDASIEPQNELLAALKGVLERYAGLVNCGDCGFWDIESEPEVIAARKAIARSEGVQE